MYKACLILYILILTSFLLSDCTPAESPNNTPIDEVAYNKEVADQMKRFEGKGVLSDSSQPLNPFVSLAAFKTAEDLQIQTILSEPEVMQPLYIDFDHRGRLWVVEYKQYPYPKGLKVKGADEFLRIQYDKIPIPPPEGIKGADQIKIFEDTDNDGIFDKHTTPIKGLNIATSFAIGRGCIWVLNPPFLLAYPDIDYDGIPEGPPEIHLEGFGIQDTHAVANSLRWGPDGWLYGAQGSTNISNVSSKVSQNVKFQGQVIWRYQPVTRVFEIFAEGGGNTFYIEFDAKGRLYSGDNGVSRGQYYKQGSYFVRNFDKHGPFTNPNTFGYLNNMRLNGEHYRFTHAWIKYEGNSLPLRYHDKMIALNPLLGFIQVSRFQERGSTFRIIDEEKLVQTTDRWFRPVDIKAGPDGAIYIADWYDSRLSHVNARDTWHKSSGRIYRLAAKNIKPQSGFDLSKNSAEELIILLKNKNKWFRQQALKMLGDKQEQSSLPVLYELLKKDSAQNALEALWAIHLISGELNDELASVSLTHSDPYVRMWGVRLICDKNQISNAKAALLNNLAAMEKHPEVISQIASSAKRLPGNVCLSIIRNLITNNDIAQDPDIPYLIWWAIESKSETEKDDIVSLFTDPSLKTTLVLNDFLAKRIIRRYAVVQSPENSLTMVKLINTEKNHSIIRSYLKGLFQGFQESGAKTLSPHVVEAIMPYKEIIKPEVPALLVKLGKEAAINRAMQLITDRNTSDSDKLLYIQTIGETKNKRAVPVFMKILKDPSLSDTIKKGTLHALQMYSEDDIGVQILKIYPDILKNGKDLTLAAQSFFTARKSWALQFLSVTGQGKLINPDEIPIQVIKGFRQLQNDQISQAVASIRPELYESLQVETAKRVLEIKKMIISGKGDPSNGKLIFSANCGNCHRLFNVGGNIGPDLTGYDRKNLDDILMNTIDPNAEIREGYVYYKVITKDERTLFGKILERNGDRIILESISGERTLLTPERIKLISAQKESIMPGNLLNKLSEKEIRDLFEFIKQ